MKLGENMNLSKKEKRLFIILIGVLIIIFINSIKSKKSYHKSTK